jgi:stage IV sporulation protein B
MHFIKSYKKRFIIFLAVCITVLALCYIQTLTVLPGRITLLEGEEYIYNFKSPLFVNIKADRNGIIKLNSCETNANGSNLRLSDPISLKTEKRGIVNLNFRIFGVIPLKVMQIDIVPNRKIVACGNTIGVKIGINGILVIGMSSIETVDGKKVFPAKDGGVRLGDILLEINKSKIESTDDLVREIDNSNGNILKVEYKRGNNLINTEIRPIKDSEDKKYHIGLWVRDGTAGIGTLTFYDPATKNFGALGHGITDIDTGILMPVKSGDILESNILAVKKGQAGNPGELKGVFEEDRNNLGIISKNCEFGIYGKLSDDAIARISDNLYPIGLQGQIKEGPAIILANIDGKTVNKYNVEIEKVSKQNYSGTKGMIIHITDNKLLELTGGIVQGMSGSPIIQDGHIIGAVTHVLVNDPSRGYGIFIENMLKHMSEESREPLQKAG